MPFKEPRQKHNWDSTKISCLKCGMSYKHYKYLLQDLDAAEVYGDDPRPILIKLRCI